MKRREFLAAAAALATCASLPRQTKAGTTRKSDLTLFPTDLPGPEWVQFRAAGYSQAVSGVVYRLRNKVTNGLALGGVDTGCLDLETSGLLGYMTLFNAHVPRRGPLNLPLLGFHVSGRTWVLCDPKQVKQGQGSYQEGATDQKYRLWKNTAYAETSERLLPTIQEIQLQGVETVKDIHYWGHYPVADLEFDAEAPLSVGLRAWAPFLPGDVVRSMLPGIVFEVNLRNRTDEMLRGTLAISFPGPTALEAGSRLTERQQIRTDRFAGVTVNGALASYALGVIDMDRVRCGGELGADGRKWAAMAQALPDTSAEQAGSSVAVDFTLPQRQAEVVRFVLTWHAPTWNAGGYNGAGAKHLFTHMYARHYPSAVAAAERLSKDHAILLKRVLAWQQVIYSEQQLPLWLRDSLINVLYMMTEDGLWAQAKPPLPVWVKPEDGLFGMNECPRGCPQIECIPCSFYGNQPIVYFFPELALSTLRGYKGYQYPDGAPPWVFGGCTGSTAPIDFANPTRGYQYATNGISLAAIADRYFLCHGRKDKSFIHEFYPVLKRCMQWTVKLRTTPSYSIGEKIIAMPSADSDEIVKPPTEWFEAPEPGWAGVTAHIAGLRLAQLSITERFAELAGDQDFVEQCRLWTKAAAEALESRLWAGRYYLNYLEPETGRKSELVFGYQLDGQWITDHHGLPSALPEARVKTVLKTIKRCNIKVTRYGAVNYANADGTPAQVKGYGTYSYFPPEALMLAMNYIYRGQKEFGVELARKVWHNLVCVQGYTWDMPNIMRGDVDTGERTYGNDYYQDMMLWSLPAALTGTDFGGPAKPGGLVDRIIIASRY
jgi:uncharacterized protein (DUF608 family)